MFVLDILGVEFDLVDMSITHNYISLKPTDTKFDYNKRSLKKEVSMEEKDFKGDDLDYLFSAVIKRLELDINSITTITAIKGDSDNKRNLTFYYVGEDGVIKRPKPKDPDFSVFNNIDF